MTYNVFGGTLNLAQSVSGYMNVMHKLRDTHVSIIQLFSFTCRTILITVINMNAR